MKKITLTYSQLRSILCLAVENTTLKGFLQQLISGDISAFSELQLLEIIAAAQVDLDIIRIVSGKDPATLDAIEAMEVISSFFAYIRANSEKYLSWLGSLGLALPNQADRVSPQTTP